MNQAQFEPAKWIAIVAMTVDHYGKIVDPAVYEATNAVGRLAFPLFAWIIGSRLGLDGGLATRYLRHLLPWAIVTQPVYVWAGKDWADPNIFFTLAMGVALHLAFDAPNRHRTMAGLILSATTLFVVMGADHGVFGLFIIPVVAWLTSYRPEAGALGVGPLGLLANLVTHPPYLGPGAAWAMPASLFAWTSIRVPLTLPRLPRLFFYAYYPAHLLILTAIARL